MRDGRDTNDEHSNESHTSLLPHRRSPSRNRSTQTMAIFVALLAIVYVFYTAAPTSVRAVLPPGLRSLQVPTTTTIPGIVTQPVSTPTTTTTAPPTPSMSTTPTTTPVTTPATAVPPATLPFPATTPTVLSLSASASPVFAGSSIQVTVTAELSSGNAGFGGQMVGYSGPGCSSASATTTADGSAIGVMTCAEADTIPITVVAAGKMVVTTVQA